MESGNTTPINLQKLLTPASDSTELLQVKNKKMYASSYFYAPSHPTVEDQVELARRISNSLSDIKNVKSKGQSMYVNRKKRSVKWIHDGAEEEEEPSSPKHKDKVPLKCVMNPRGQVLDIHGIQALGEEVNMQTMPEHPEKLFDIVRDLNNQKGRGAEIFAKRRKRSEKWVVDTEQPQSPSNYNFGKAPTYPMKAESGANENSKFESKPFYNPFVDLSMDYSTPPVSSCAYVQHQHAACNFSSGHSDCSPCHTEVKKIYLREVAVGTEPEIAKVPDKSPRRSNIDAGSRGRVNGSSNGHGRPSRKQSNGHHHQPNNYQPYPAKSNGYHSHQNYGFSYHNGHNLQHSQSLGNGNGYYSHQNGNGCHHNGIGQLANGNGYHQNGNGCHQNGNAYHPNGNAQQQTNEDGEENPDEDYTPVPVKQLIQEFEKTCRPVMQYKQYSPRVVVPENNNQNDISRFFESRREVVYHTRRGSGDDRHHHPHQQQQQQQQRASHPQYRGNNGFASSADEENDDEDEDDDEDESLDDSLSPVEFYRIDDRRLFSQTNNVNGNRSSSMSTLDEYYRRQLQQRPLPDTIEDEKKSGEEAGEDSCPLAVCPAKKDAPGPELSEEDILAAKKLLKNTTVLENLVAGTTTPECFKKEFTEEVAGKLYDGTYHGPKINSYQNLKNYNTAPRGWDGSQPVYKPVRFEKPQDPKIVYSDF